MIKTKTYYQNHLFLLLQFYFTDCLLLITTYYIYNKIRLNCSLLYLMICAFINYYIFFYIDKTINIYYYIIIYYIFLIILYNIGIGIIN